MTVDEAFFLGFRRGYRNKPPVKGPGKKRDKEAARAFNADYGVGVSAGIVYRAWKDAGAPWPFK